MDLRLQPKPEIDIEPADKGIVSREKYFTKKVLEEINQYFYPGHLIRNWRSKADLIYLNPSNEETATYEYDFNRNVQNCFVEDFAEEIYVRSPPPCFVVLGKSGPNVDILGRRIADEYGSVFINVDNVVEQVIGDESETATFLRKVLHVGTALTVNIILSLVSYLAHTPEAKHRGYVLSGYPCPSYLCDGSPSVEQQLDYLFCWENKPTVFVYVLFEDEDLIRTRSRIRYEVGYTSSDQEKTTLTRRIVSDEDEDGLRNGCDSDNGDDEDDDEEEEDEDEEDDGSGDESSSPETDRNVSPSRPWIQLPKDTNSFVWFELELFNKTVKPALDLLTSRVDPQYFITVDSRIPNEFEIVMSRLSLLQIWKVPVPFPFITPVNQNESSVALSEVDNEDEAEDEEENEEEMEIQRVAEEPPRKAFTTLFSKKTPSPKFRWELSHYNYICPVSLRGGDVIEGKTRYAVVFMKYIYFMRDEKCMNTFLRNPRPFVLPIRPKPPTRLLIIGYPFCGKTTLAKSLANEFSIPLVNLNTVLQNDLEGKKEAYLDYCRKKAESRQIIHLTAQAWRDWRMEEEQRVSLIEDWMEYMQSLLNQRIEEFYCGEKCEPLNSSPDIQQSEREGEEVEEDDAKDKTCSGGRYALRVQGVPISLDTSDVQEVDSVVYDSYSTPSTKIMKAFKHEDYDFDQKGFEVEANLFFSALWNEFPDDSRSEVNKTDADKLGEDDVSNKSLAGEDDQSVTSFNWCHLLPPQSLSSLLLKKKPYTVRERRRSFRVLLSAASKAHRTSNVLRHEFAKWRLPCFMDIPLCEILADNPLLLYKYCPEWIKHMPLIPDPVDPNHPAVVEAGRLACKRASAVTLQHTTEEVGILLRDAIEKAERDGMRVAGDNISPGGWVVDNMVLDLQVWCILLKANITPTHIYCLLDSTPDFRRIINTWNDLYNESPGSGTSLKEPTPSIASSETEIDEEQYNSEETNPKESESDNSKLGDFSPAISIIKILLETCYDIAKGEEELDDIFEKLIMEGGIAEREVFQPLLMDPFSHNVLQSKHKRSFEQRDETPLEESTLATMNLSSTGRILFSSRSALISIPDLFLGANLEKFTSKVLNLLRQKSQVNLQAPERQRFYEDGVKFFVYLIGLSQRLDELKEWLTTANIKREVKIIEMDVNGKSAEDVLKEILKELNKPFGKRPRELESFEVEEIDEALRKETRAKTNGNVRDDDVDEDEGEDAKNADSEDVRIYGESGPFCIVNLERNILLQGSPEHALRYYGKLYFFWSEECKAKFLQDPEKYAPYYSPIRCLPPLRIFLMGPLGSDKSLLAESISGQCGLHFIDYITFLNKKLIPHVSPGPNKLKALDASLLVSDAHNAEARKALAEFKGASYMKRKFWLENPPFYTDLWETDDVLMDLLNLKDDHYELDGTDLNYQTIDVDARKVRSDEGPISDVRPPFLSMNDITALLESYIHEKGTLNEFCIDRTLKLLWNAAPYTTEGFVLKDFPLRASDSQIIVKNHWIPDLLIEVNVTEEEAINWNIDRVMETWDRNLKQQVIEEQILEDSVRSIRDTKIHLRRLQLAWKKRDTGVASAENVKHGIAKYPSIRKLQDHVEKTKLRKEDRKSSLRAANGPATNWQVTMSTSFLTPGKATEVVDYEDDEIIRKEFPSLIFNPKFETYDEGRERMIATMTANYRKDREEIDKIKEELQSINVPWLEVRDPSDTTDIFILLNALKKRLNQRGEFAFPVSMDMAEKLLRQGFYYLSKFGRLCPVQAYRRRNPIHMFRPHTTRGKVFPVVYRNYIYFIGGETEKVKFIADPIRYTFNEPHYTYIPLRVSVIGPPKSGKSTLCKRLGLMFGLKVVTMGTAIRFVLEKMPGTLLRKSINGYLKRGCFLPLSLKIEALMACLIDPDCVTQGYVLDGIPFDAAMTQSLAEKRNLPFVIISLTAEACFGKQNRQKLDLSAFRLPYKQRVNLDTRYKEWNESYKKFFQWNEDTYNNLYELKATSSVVDVFYGAFDIIKKPYFGILDYVEQCVTDRSLHLAYLCISPQEYELRKSPLHLNCPVCWVETSRLRGPTDNKEHLGLVSYLGFIYWVCTEHFDKFSRNPKSYVPPHSPDWPTHLPQAITKSAYDAIKPKPPVHGLGRCPVTKTDLPNSLNWEGSWTYAALYKDEVFLCRNQEMLERFLAQPWRYSEADTVYEAERSVKSKAVENLGPPKLTSLPPIGFLEQTVAKLIQDALQVLGSVRPVYPHLTPSCTACIFVALYLKVHNKPKTAHSLEKEYLDFMHYYCKAYRFKTPFIVPRNDEEEGQGDFDTELVDSLDSTSHAADSEDKFSYGTINDTLSTSQDDAAWTDLECQADKKLWSAKYKDPNYTEMLLNSDDELEDVLDLPALQVVVRYKPMRLNPLPPIPNCLTFVYCRRPNLVLPDEFKISSLYQGPPDFVSPYNRTITCNPDRQFSMTLYTAEDNPPRADTSAPNLWRCHRTKENDSASMSEESKRDDADSVTDLIVHRFVPRFHLLDTVKPVQLPKPKVVEYPPVVFEPQRDYTYAMLMSHFFHTSNLVRCYEWLETKGLHEYANLLDRSLGLCNVRSQFFFKPEVRPSMRTNPSVQSYLNAFETRNTFFFRNYRPEKDGTEEDEDVNEEDEDTLEDASSVVNFMQFLILDKLDEIFLMLSLSDLSYDSYELNVLSIGSEFGIAKPAIFIREILPYPPLIWDIASRPYYALSAVNSVFDIPLPDNIAHERHVSLLDGIVEPYDTFRFVRYPTWVQPNAQVEVSEVPETRGKCHRGRDNLLDNVNFYYDFFHLPWTSFLCYPFSLAYDTDLTTQFKPSPEQFPEGF